MRTRSQTCNRNCQQQSQQAIVQPFHLEEPFVNPPLVPMADNRTMAQLLQAPTEGYEDAIVIPEINANFELKHGSTRIWLEKEPLRSILTWDDLVSKFINQFFPPSKTTNLRNEITRFQQRFDESFYEAWDRFNDLLRACPHHGFSELHQLDTFYNALNANDQDSLNSAAGGNFLDKMPRECLRIIESKSKVRNSRNKAVVAKVSSNSSTPGISPDVAALTTEVSELKNLMKTMLLDKQKAQAPTTVKAVEQSCVTCGANFNQGNTNHRPPMVSNQIRPLGFPLIQNNQNRFNPNQGNNFNQNRGTSFNQNRGSNFNQGQVYQPPTIQPPVYQAPPQQMQGVSKTDFENYVKANDVVLRNMQNQGQGLQNQMTNLTEMLSKFITSNTASSSNSGTLPSQTVTNPREHVNAITTRSGKTCEGPSTPLVPTPVVSTPLKEPEQNPETSMDKVQKPSSENTAQVPPPEDHDSIFIEIPKPKAKKTVQEPNSPEPNSYQPKLPYPERMKVREKDTPSAQQSRFMKLFKQLRLEIGLKDALIEMPKFNKWLSTLLRNKEKLEEIDITTVNAKCSAIILNKVHEKLEDPGKFLILCALQELDRTNALADSGASINLLPYSIYNQLGLGALKHTRMTLELANHSVTHPMGIAEDVVVRVDGFTFLVDFVVVNFVVVNANSELKCVKCNGCMLSDNHDLCVLDFINNVNARKKSKSVKKSSKRKVWKPTGKVFTNIGYIWRPTGRTFTIVGNACPLTRITTTAEVPLRKPTALENETPKMKQLTVVQIVLWYLDSGCSKHMTGDRSQLTNFVNKFLGTVKFGNDHMAKIMGYGDYQIGNVTISRVYYVEGLGHNLFSVGQFCDSNLEVAFRQHTCFIRNLEGVDLLTGSRGNNLYTLSLGDMMASSLICLLSKASKTKSWLWHRRLSHLNFGTINHLARHGLVRGLPKLKFKKDHLCSACAMGKSKKKPHIPKSKDTNQEKLYLLHMDLCGPMRVASVNGKKYILVIVDDYSRFT
ncbi:reverse transcriptase domain-containing protein [Tanacetum coccineum]